MQRNKEVRQTNESSILMFVTRNPGSSYSEIKRGLLNSSGPASTALKLSDPALTRHLKRMRELGGPLVLKGDRYYINEDHARNVGPIMLEAMQAAAGRITWYEHALANLSTPEGVVEAGLEMLLYDFIWTLRQALAEQKQMELCVAMHLQANAELMKALILVLSKQPGAREEVERAYKWIGEEQDKESLARCNAKVPAPMRPISDAFLATYRSHGVHKNVLISEWLDLIIAERDGAPRKAFEAELGRAVDVFELLDFKKAAFSKG